jgi:KaiC/GvpD/RAD55 family RecA-like ATPase/class 3 adenylate cyclase
MEISNNNNNYRINNNPQIESDNDEDPMVQIPGIFDLTGKNNIPPSLFLLVASAGTGKSMYCRQFIMDGILRSDYCIYISPNMTEKKFRSLFPKLEAVALNRSTKFINPYLHIDTRNIAKNSNDTADDLDKLKLTLAEIHEILVIQKRENEQHNSSIHGHLENSKNKDLSSSSSSSSKGISMRVVVDSLTQFFVLFGESAVLKFIGELSLLLKEFEASAIFTLTGSLTSPNSLTNAVSSMVDGILEMRLEEGKDGSLARSIRMVSINGIHHKPAWIQFNITDDGGLVFGDQSTISSNCTMCGKPIRGTPLFDSEFPFDSIMCMETYRKLTALYGSNISSETGLPAQVVNINFFFIDIVGLSNPSLSVKKQIDKIEILNKLVGLCDAFAKAKEKKIVLPTGDGMAIGFFMNPESPLQLAVQLHSKLRTYNRGKSYGDLLGVRIGLGSGPVFIVNDINGNQNVWGPGIILARRVMDIGDNSHILLSNTMAESLIALKDEYKMMLKPIGDYQIKHGQTLHLYSAYSQEFGNPESPAKMLSQH